MSESGQPLSKLADKYTKYHHIPETNFKVADKVSAIARITEAFSDSKQDQLDGLTVWFEDAWLNIRPSNTEPILRLNAEANSQQRLDSLVAKVTALIT